MHTAARVGAGHALLAAAGLLVGAAVFFGGGSGDRSVLPLGAALLAVLAVALVMIFAGLRPALPPAAGAVALLVALGGLLAWEGASVAWSIAPDRSWDAFDKDLVAAGFLGLGLLAASGPRACRAAAALLAALIAAALAWALAGKAIPALFPDGGRAARLRSPVGYWNGLALLAGMALPLALWLGTRGRRSLAAAGGVVVYAGTATILLAASRTGLVAGVVAIAAWLALADRRVEGALLALAGTVPGTCLAAWAFTRSALVEDGQSHADRVRDGAVFGLLLLVGAALVVAAVAVASRRELRRRREVGRALVLGASGAAAAGAVALVIAVGNPFTWAADQFSSPGATSNAPTRFLEASSNNRWQWWNEAWDVFRADPVQGAGAGTFAVARLRYRDDALAVTEPHNVPLQMLAGGGLVGLALFLAVVAAAAAVAVRALRRLAQEERAAAAALAVVPLAFLVHSIADYDWDFLAATAPALFALGVLGGAGRPAARVRRPFWAIAAVAAAVVAVASLATPRLAERAVSRADAALERGDADAALNELADAHALDPFSLEPVLNRALIEEGRGHLRAARRSYVAAVKLQPDNPEPWFELGSFDYRRGNLCAAYFGLNEAYTRDPSGLEWTPGGSLDQARAFVNTGACSR